MFCKQKIRSQRLTRRKIGLSFSLFSFEFFLLFSLEFLKLCLVPFHPRLGDDVKLGYHGFVGFCHKSSEFFIVHTVAHLQKGIPESFESFFVVQARVAAPGARISWLCLSQVFQGGFNSAGDALLFCTVAKCLRYISWFSFAWARASRSLCLSSFLAFIPNGSLKLNRIISPFPTNCLSLALYTFLCSIK